jgi:hypothetical protein
LPTAAQGVRQVTEADAERVTELFALAFCDDRSQAPFYYVA